MGLFAATAVCMLLLVTHGTASNCTEVQSSYYCTAYDDTGEYIRYVIRSQTLISAKSVPELANRDIFIDSEATFYHSGHTGLQFASVHIAGTGHLFLDGHSSIAIVGNLTLESGASLSIGIDSTVHIHGSLYVQPGAILFGVVNSAKELLTFKEGGPDFTHFAVRQNSVTSAPEIFFQRMLCETPAFTIEDGRQDNAVHRLFVCNDNSYFPDAVVIYNRTLLSSVNVQLPLIKLVPVPVPVPVPPIITSPVNETDTDMLLYGGIDVDPRRVWPYYVLFVGVILGIAIYVVVVVIFKKKIKTKMENVKILLGGDDNNMDEYELSPMSFVDLVPDFASSSSQDLYEGDRGSVLMGMLSESAQMRDRMTAVDDSVQLGANSDESSSSNTR